MATSYTFRDGVICVRLAGEYTLDEWFHTLDAALTDSKRPRQAVLLTDLTESTVVADRSTDDVKRSANFVAERAAEFGHRVGVIAPADIQYGLMRMAEMLLESHDIEMGVFRSHDEAWSWLTGPTETDDLDAG